MELFGGAIVKPNLSPKKGDFKGKPHLEVVKSGSSIKPLALYAILTVGSCTVGDLVDLANGIPNDWILPIAAELSESIRDDFLNRKRSRMWRRKLVVMGALLNRVIFEVEGIPKDRNRRV